MFRATTIIRELNVNFNVNFKAFSNLIRSAFVGE